MGWTSYHVEMTWNKNGKFSIDRKRECDNLFTSSMIDKDNNDIGKFEVLKSAMIGSVYYAAVKRTKFKTEEKPEEVDVFAAVCLTNVKNSDYYNFAYKDMDETCGPYEIKCPASIIKLLTPTDNEYANEWRAKCMQYNTNKKNPRSLSNLPIGTKIKFIAPYDLKDYKKGDEVTVWKEKRHSYGKRKTTYWIDGFHYYPTKLIGNEFTVLD